MPKTLILVAMALGLSLVSASAEEAHDLLVDGQPWLRTVTPPFDDSTKAARDETFKVYTHVYNFDGDAFITKGHGGKYSHHRGLFIGWLSTTFNDAEVDTWHMRGSYQRHAKWLDQSPGAQSEIVEWCTDDGEPFISETRTITAKPGPNNTRIIDFASELTALNADIALRGDLQHAGMQIRLANEVSRHEETTQYILPQGATENENDEVIGAWWVLGSAEVEGKRYWIMHMTPPSHPLGVPVYSIRRYARFGAFFEPDLKQGQPYPLTFRILVSETELDREAAQALYDDYAQTATE